VAEAAPVEAKQSPASDLDRPAQNEAAVKAAEARAQVLHQHRKWLMEIDRETSASHDKMLLTLAAGALGLAVNFGRGKSVWPMGLQIAVGCFTVSLLALLFSYQTCRREVGKGIGQVDQSLSSGEEDALALEQPKWHEVSTTILNNTALIALIAGICFFSAFAGMNL
jgi:hypothetical protein